MKENTFKLNEQEGEVSYLKWIWIKPLNDFEIKEVFLYEAILSTKDLHLFYSVLLMVYLATGG